MDYSYFTNLFNEKLREKGMTLKKLSEISGISLKHLENLCYGNFDELPPAPYVRSYILRLGQILDLDAQQWWEETQKFLKSSSTSDAPPQNRFSGKSASVYRWIIPTIIILVLATYFTFNFYKISGQARVVISSPAENPAITQNGTIIFSGRLISGNKILINNERISTDKDGYFSKEIVLQPGLNAVEITAKKFLGDETKTTRQVIYQPPAASSTNSANELK